MSGIHSTSVSDNACGMVDVDDNGEVQDGFADVECLLIKISRQSFLRGSSALAGNVHGLLLNRMNGFAFRGVGSFVDCSGYTAPIFDELSVVTIAIV